MVKAYRLAENTRIKVLTIWYTFCMILWDLVDKKNIILVCILFEEHTHPTPNY